MNTFGIAVALSPFVVVSIVLIAKATSTAEGRWAALFVFGATTLIMIPAIAGLVLAGRPAGPVAAVVMASLDVLVAGIALAKVGIDRVRRAGGKP